MCGIVGFVGLTGDEAEASYLLKRMCDTIIYRGPDDEGYFVDPTCGLGIRRLSIIDLSTGSQPISSLDGKKHIVFNGEIYNYKALRQQLAAKGYTFKTESDTEVILAQYEQDGPDCVHKLNGMFIFAIWDQEKQTLFIARDRLGIKPLYYFWNGRELIFGSEIKTLLASGHIKKEINMQAIWDYLTFRYVPSPESIWNNICKLPPAHTLLLDNEKRELKVNRYWDIPYTDNIKKRPDSEILDEFSDLFLDAVRLRLISDVPVGVLLSGGLDSSAVAAAIAEVHNAPLNSFSVTFQNSPGTDETPFAKLVAQHVGLNHHEIVIDENDFIGFLPKFVHFTDEPLADLASVPLYYVSNLASQKVKVVLSGEGSDEIFGGYTFDVLVDEFNRRNAYQRLPAFLRNGKGWSLMQRFFGQRLHEHYSANPISLDQRLAPIPLSATNYLSTEQKRKLFTQSPIWPDSYDLIRNSLKRINTANPLNQLLFIYSQDWLVEDLLMKADRTSMANSLELRVPFLDYRMVEWAAGIDPKYKISKNKNGKYTTKVILREWAKTRLPSEIIERPKMGFPVPVYDWLSGTSKPWVKSILGDPQAMIRSWFDQTELDRLISDGTANDSQIMPRHYLWALLILEIWCREWLQG